MLDPFAHVSISGLILKLRSHQLQSQGFGELCAHDTSGPKSLRCAIPTETPGKRGAFRSVAALHGTAAAPDPEAARQRSLAFDIQCWMYEYLELFSFDRQSHRLLALPPCIIPAACR